MTRTTADIIAGWRKGAMPAPGPWCNKHRNRHYEALAMGLTVRDDDEDDILGAKLSALLDELPA